MTRRKPETRIQKMLRSDGALCLTFVNTGLGKREALESYADMLAWGIETGVVDTEDASRLEHAVAERPDEAAEVVRRATTLRAQLERILAAVAGGLRPAAAAVEAFNVELGAALCHRRLVATASGFRWSWGDAGGDAAGRMLWPVMLSAGELLAGEDLHRVRQCPNRGCGLLFVARGAGRPRKWCGPACRDRGTSLRHYRQVIKPKRERLASQRQAEQKARLAGYDDA